MHAKGKKPICNKRGLAKGTKEADIKEVGIADARAAEHFQGG